MKRWLILESNATVAKMIQFTKRLLGTNLLWFLFNIPLVAIGYYTFTINNNYLVTLMTIACLAPLILFPATSAMFAVLRQFIMGKEVLIMQSFLQYYKENYVNSFLGSILLSILWYLLAYASFLWTGINPFLSLLIFIIAVFLFVFTTNFISTIVHMEVNLFAAYKNAFIITIGAPLLTIVMGAISAAIIYVSVNVISIIIPLITGAIIAYISFSGYYKMMINIQYLNKMAEEEKEESEENIEEEST